MSNFPNVPMFTSNVPGLSTSASVAVAQRGTPATLNLDDIFGDVYFTPEGDTVFMGEQQGGGVLPSGEKEVANFASKPQGQMFVPVPQAGGIQTTNQLLPNERSLAMGPAAAAPVAPVPYTQPPQQSHHLQFATPAMLEAQQQQKAKRNRPMTTAAARSAERKMSDQQKVERRYVSAILPYHSSLILLRHVV